MGFGDGSDPGGRGGFSGGDVEAGALGGVGASAAGGSGHGEPGVDFFTQWEYGPVLRGPLNQPAIREPGSNVISVPDLTTQNALAQPPSPPAPNNAAGVGQSTSFDAAVKPSVAVDLSVIDDREAQANNPLSVGTTTATAVVDDPSFAPDPSFFDDPLGSLENWATKRQGENVVFTGVGLMPLGTLATGFVRAGRALGLREEPVGELSTDGHTDGGGSSAWQLQSGDNPANAIHNAQAGNSIDAFDNFLFDPSQVGGGFLAPGEISREVGPGNEDPNPPQEPTATNLGNAGRGILNARTTVIENAVGEDLAPAVIGAVTGYTFFGEVGAAIGGVAGYALPTLFKGD